MKPHIRNGKVVLLGGRIALVPCPEDCCSLCDNIQKPDGYSPPNPSGVPFSTFPNGFNDVSDLCKNFPTETGIQFQCTSSVDQRRLVFNSQQGTVTAVPNIFPYCCFLGSSRSIGRSDTSPPSYIEAILSGRLQARLKTDFEFRRANGDDERIVLSANIDVVRSDLSGERNNGRVPGIPFDALLEDELRTRYTSASGNYVFERFVNGQLASTDTIDLSFFTPPTPENETATTRLGRRVWGNLGGPRFPGLNTSGNFPPFIFSTYMLAYIRTLLYIEFIFRLPNDIIPKGVISALGRTQYQNFSTFMNYLDPRFPLNLLNKQFYLLRFTEDSAWDCRQGQTCRRWFNPNFNAGIGVDSLRKGSVTYYWSSSINGCSGPPGGNLP